MWTVKVDICSLFKVCSTTRNISCKLSAFTLIKISARLIIRYRDIFPNISEGTAFLLQGVTENDSRVILCNTLKKEGRARIILCNTLKKEGRAFSKYWKIYPCTV